MTFYFIWIPLAILVYVLEAVLTKRANVDSSWKWVFWLYVVNAVGMWPIVARFSKNLVFDALLYDVIIFFSFMLTLLYLDAASRFNTVQWVGTAMVMIGFVVLKIGAKL